MLKLGLITYLFTYMDQVPLCTALLLEIFTEVIFIITHESKEQQLWERARPP